MFDRHTFGSIRFRLEKALHFTEPGPAGSALGNCELKFEPNSTHTLSLITPNGEHEPSLAEKYVEVNFTIHVPLARLIELLRTHRGKVEVWLNGAPVSLEELAHAA